MWLLTAKSISSARRLILPVMFLLAMNIAVADVAHFEQEPNDRPENFNPIDGAITLYGNLPDADQDGYTWTVSDDDARKRWTFELHGAPGTKLTLVSVMQLVYANNGIDVSDRRKLFDMKSRDGARPVIRESLVFDPGEYVIGFAQGGESTGDGAYRFFIHEESMRVSKNPTAVSARETAHDIRPGASFTTFETGNTAWYRFDFDEPAAANRWTISVQAPVGRKLQASLHNAGGEELISGRINEKGRFEFRDLAPPVGTWYLKLETSKPGMIQSITTVATGIHVAGQEAEPNNEYKHANHVDLSQPLTGHIGDGDSEDKFIFSVEESNADTLQSLRLDSATPGKLTFCLKSSDWKDVQCRNGKPPLEMTDLLLSPGDWGIHLRRAQAQDYVITLEPQGAREALREFEPNDDVKYANGMPDNMRIKGRFSGDDSDFFQFHITGEPQRWRFQTNGDGLRRLSYLDGRGKQKATVGASKGAPRIRLDNLLLLPGRHAIEVRGRDGEYTLLARALGPPFASPPDAEAPVVNALVPVTLEPGPKQAGPKKQSAIWNPDGEVEPNDELNMQRVAFGQVRTGTLPDTEDIDHYRFFVANHDHLKLTIEPANDSTIRAKLHWYETQLGVFDAGAPGVPVTYEGLLPPGDYHLTISAGQASDNPYRLKLERLPRFSCPTDCEPNGRQNLDFAAPLPPDLMLEGVVGDWRDDDVYQLPAFDHETELLIRSDDTNQRIRLLDSGGDFSPEIQHQADLDAYRLNVPGGPAHRLVISGNKKSYHLQLEFPAGDIKPVNGNLTAEISLQLDANEVAAFLNEGQQLSGKVTLRNTGAENLALRLLTTSSDYRWRADLEKKQVTIAAGETITVPLSVNAPSDAWADHTVRISVKASDHNGKFTESWSDIEAGRSTHAVNARLHWPVPVGLRGGFNVAWAPLGATWTNDTPKKARDDKLRDGLVAPSHVTWCCDSQEPVLTLDLPGDDPLPVKGFSIDTFGNQSIHRSIRQATLLLSQDGENFSEVLSIKALPVLTEQYFELPESILARFARLRIDSSFELPMRDVGVGEWKIILEPGFELSAGQGFNLADPAVGGHLVRAHPPDGSANRILNNEDDSAWVKLDRHNTVEYVIGFNRNRAAQVQSIEWQYEASINEAQRNFRSINVSASNHSPVGPWHSLGKMELAASDTSALLELDAPAWARFVRFEALIDPEANRTREPTAIRILERPGGDDYLSILTEWGEAGGRAFFELQAGIPKATAPVQENNSRDHAALLNLGERARHSVALGRWQNWFRLSVPMDLNTLSFEMTGDPTVRTILKLEDASGDPILLNPVRRGTSPRAHLFDAFVEPGQDVWINISEPPRNVVFSWDTSGSVGPYLPRIYNSVMAFSGEVIRDHEWVNLLPFGRGFLLKDWSDDPLILQTVLNDYRGERPSSDAEKALDRASKALARRPGTKAVVMVTDAITPYFGDMWKSLALTQPRVFGVGVGGSGMTEQNRFRDWAAVNGGDYRQLRYLGEMDVAFDRASTKMHRPAAYTLLVEGEFRESPGPGRLRVVEGNPDSRTAVELILDASGSMLQRVEGKRRINVAKEVLIEAVREHIPAGTPVALRVFGHKEADSCRTDLEIPLAPLNPESASKKISGINAMNLARTPIADSLAAVQKDLKGIQSAAIVLVTDGEETCDGDPAAVIESLREKGLDISLNIVGLAIADGSLASQFESWAESGGGRYFSADNQAGLSEALKSALRTPFSVYDQDGNEVASGEVGGDPIELERGQYQVLVRTSPPQSFNDVMMQGEDDRMLKLE